MEAKISNIKQIRKMYNNLSSEYDTKWDGYLRSTNEVAISLANLTLKDKILDASGGTGMLAEQIISNNHGVNIVLIDASEGMLNIARQRLNKYKKIVIESSDAHNLPFKDSHFTKVLCVNALHHYYDARKALSEFYRVLRPNGSVIIVDWCRDSFHFVLFDFFMKARAEHSKTYKSKELEVLLNEIGFKVEDKIRWQYHLWSLMGIKAKKEVR